MPFTIIKPAIRLQQKELKLNRVFQTHRHEREKELLLKKIIVKENRRMSLTRYARQRALFS